MRANHAPAAASVQLAVSRRTIAMTRAATRSVARRARARGTKGWGSSSRIRTETASGKTGITEG